MTPLHRASRNRVAILIFVLFCLVGLAFLWKVHVPGDTTNLAAMISELRLSASELYAWEVIIYVLLASALAIPLGIIIVANSLLFGPIVGTLYTMLGATLGATLSYSIGNYLGHDGVLRFGGERINRISCRLAERGVLSVVIIRMLPIAPFAIINMIAGASHLRIRDFILGTVLGMLPGALFIAFSVGQVQHWLFG